VPLRTPLTLEDARVAVTPLNGFLRLAGTMEFGGLEETVNPRRIAAIKQAAADSLIGWDNPPGEAAPWAGLRPMTPDGLPIIGVPVAGGLTAQVGLNAGAGQGLCERRRGGRRHPRRHVAGRRRLRPQRHPGRAQWMGAVRAYLSGELVAELVPQGTLGRLTGSAGKTRLGQSACALLFRCTVAGPHYPVTAQCPTSGW